MDSRKRCSGCCPPHRQLFRASPIRYKNCLTAATLYLLISGCVSAGRPWIPPEETAQALQAWEKSEQTESKEGWIFIDEQFIQIGFSDPPINNNLALIAPENFTPTPQKKLGEIEDVMGENNEKEEYRASRYFYIYSTVPLMKDEWWHIQVGHHTRSGEEWSKQILDKKRLKISCKNKKPRKIQIFKEKKFESLKLNNELNRSEMGLPSLKALLKNLTVWICRQEGNYDFTQKTL